MLLPSRAALAALALLALAGSAPTSAAEPRKTPTPTPAPAAEGPIYDSDLIGTQAIEAAQKTANESGRRLLLNLGTNDCSACAVFNRAIHKDKFFQLFGHQFVTESIDVTNLPNAALLDKYLINPRAPLPAILIFMPDGRLMEALAHGEMAAIAKKGEGAVQEWILQRFAKTE